MKWVTPAVLVACLGAPAWAGYEEGDAAFRRGDYGLALRELRPLADTGSARAQARLGVMYRKGWGVPKDAGEAVRWFRPAAKRGSRLAQHNLGIMYRDGLGVSKSHKEAFKWFLLAADQGHARAQLNVGIMYRKGLGTSRDLVQAYKWFLLCEAKVGSVSVLHRDRASKKMTPAQVAEAQRLAREWQAKHGRKKPR